MNTDKHRISSGQERTGIRVRPCLSAAHDSKSGSALIMVLAVAVVLSFLVADFAADMKSELKAANGHYEEAINTQLARSAFELGRLELANGGSLYANGYGDAYLISGTEDYESEIEEMQEYRNGIAFGRGLLSYQLVYSPSALDASELEQAAWERLLEVACLMDEGDERTELVHCILDWIDEDDIAMASGMEEDDYQDLDTPRHVKNGTLECDEELLMVYGMTRDLFYGSTDNPAYIDDGMLWGGGILRYLIGDHSPEGRASADYIKTGVMPAADEYGKDDELEYSQINALPETLYLLARGYIEDETEEDGATFYGDEAAEAAVCSERIVLVRLALDNEGGAYTIDDMTGNAPNETVERILAYGVPDED